MTQMAYTLLIIEDNRAIIDALTDEFKKAFKDDIAVEACNFREALTRVRNIRPDLMVLDRFEGVAEDAARPIWDYIWQTHFCPVIVYSAYEAADSDYERSHPFTAYEQKGDGRQSIPRVIAHAKGFLEHADGLRALRDEIDDRIASSLQLVSPLIWRESNTPDQRKELLRRVARRRLAASLDSPACLTDTVIALEQFIYPPLEPSLLTGDVIKTVGADNDATAFCLVLTPSCDLQTGEKRHPVSQVLVARCIEVNDLALLRLFSLDAEAKDLAEKLGRKLKGDHRQDLCVLPKLNDVWPCMIANLKELQLLSRASIALDQSSITEKTPYVRLASLDSPFRESLAWRYAQTTGRPGLPDLDQTVLEQDIISTAKALRGQ